MTTSLGDRLYSITVQATTALFDQGELAQLTFGAFDVVSQNVSSSTSEQLEVSFPVGYRPDRTAILSTRSYAKEQLLSRYSFLTHVQLPINGIVQLVTIVEAALSDIVRQVVIRYPRKLGAKRTMALQAALEARSIEDLHLRATDALLNELSYKSPREFAENIEAILSINLLECPAYHRFIEIKSTRDIYIHNRGQANDVYVRKSGSHARVAAGWSLPIDVPYFLESYESCLQLVEWLTSALHAQWPSEGLEEARLRQANAIQRPPIVAEAVPLAEAIAEEKPASPASPTPTLAPGTKAKKQLRAKKARSDA